MDIISGLGLPTTISLYKKMQGQSKIHLEQIKLDDEYRPTAMDNNALER